MNTNQTCFEGSVYHFSIKDNTWVQDICQDNTILVKAEDPLKNENADDIFIREASDPLEISLVNTSSSRKIFFGENFVIFEKKRKTFLKLKKILK